MVGLFFFLRASVKDRTEQIQVIAPSPEESLLTQLQTYFTQRAYQVTAVDASQAQITFQGFVRPSWFLAIFLSLLAALGILCFALVLSLLYPPLTLGFLALTLLSPLVGFVYWQQAGRVEQVVLKVEDSPEQGQRRLIKITAHRDELSQLQQAMPLELIQSGH